MWLKLREKLEGNRIYIKMATGIIIDNYLEGRRYCSVLTDEDISSTDEVWDYSHMMLASLAEAGLAEPGLCWKDVSIRHLQFLIKRALDDFLQGEQQLDKADDDNTALIFLLCAYVRRLTEITGNDVDSIKIQRIADKNFSFETNQSVLLAGIQKQNGNDEAKRKFEVVVDNTTKKE